MQSHAASPDPKRPIGADEGEIEAARDVARPRVTVVVPCYNQAHFLAECLESIRAQTTPEWEVVVVDDCSPDGDEIAEVVEAFGDERVRLVRHEANKGLGGSRNTGIREARTELVYPLDADDRVRPTCLEELVDEFVADPGLDCAYGDVQLFGRLKQLIVFDGPPAGAQLLRAEDTIPGAGTMMRKALWETVGGYDESDVLRSGREDFEFWIRAFEHGCRARRVPSPLYEYRILHSSMNTTCRLQDHVIADYIYGKHQALFDENGAATGFLCAWTEQAALAAYQAGDRRQAFRLQLSSFRRAPSRRRLKAVLRTMLPYSTARAIEDGEARRRVPFATYPLRGEHRYRPFFVIGVGRSGNTLLRRVLTSHSRLHVPPETFVLGELTTRFRGWGRRLSWPELVSMVYSRFEFHPEFELFDMELAPLVERTRAAPRHLRNLAFLLDEFYREHARQHGQLPEDPRELRWGDKTPMNSLDDRLAGGDRPRKLGAGTPETLERLADVFPDAQFVHIYRDGCDVVHSHLRGGFYGRLEEAALRWRHVEAQTRRFARQHASQALDVRYEDLVQRPEEVVRGVCEFLEVSFEPGMLDSEGQAHALGDVPAWSWHRKVANPIDATNPGKARRRFSRAEREELQRLIGDELAELGYPPATADPD